MPSKLYYNPETATTWKSSGGDATLTFASTADQAIAIGAQVDRGSGAKPGLYRWFCALKVNATVVAGRQVRIHLVQAIDGTDIPGRIGTSDTEVTSAGDRARNLGAPIGVVNADSTSTSDLFTASGICFVYGRYISPVLFNDMGVALNSSETGQYFVIQPIPAESQ